MWAGSRVIKLIFVLLALLPISSGANMFNMQSARNGLIFQMGFEEGTGTTTADKSGRGLTGTLSGNTLPAWNASGKNGNSLTFSDAGKNQVRIPHGAIDTFNNPSAFTIMAWIYPTVDPGGSEHAIFAHQKGDTFGACKSLQSFDYTECSGKPSFMTYVAGQWRIQCAASKLTLNTWTHIAGTYDNSDGSLKIYIDGTLVGSSTYTGALTNCPGPYVIGGDEGPANSWQEWNDARIDDVRFYGKALTQPQINSLKDTRVP